MKYFSWHYQLPPFRRWAPLTLVALMLLSSTYALTIEYPAHQATEMVHNLWLATKQSEIDPYSGRTLDRQRNSITTSEGQAYTMLQAVWQNDQPTFNTSWHWSVDNLKRPTDSLPAWLWGERSDGTYGILTDQGGTNTASDADTDMALSLVFASDRWNQSTYGPAAKKMIADIWARDVVTITGQPVLTADNQEMLDPNQVLVNPSYFAPYAYVIFAKLDPAHNWLGLRSNMYRIISQASLSPLDQPTSDGLPPDWIVINRKSGAIRPSTTTGQTSQYSYDAMRLPFRLSLDYLWNNNSSARSLLKQYGYLATLWQTSGKIVSAYSHQGTALNQVESPSVYAGSIGYFLVVNPSLGEQIYQNKLLPEYNSTTKSWQTALGYYDQNWIWFALALYNHQLPDLSR